MSQHPPLDRSVRRAFTELCWNVGTPVAYKALKALEADDWVALVTIDVKVGAYLCPRTLSGDLQVASFFKKYPGFDLGYDLEERAKQAFWESERQCYLTNEHLAPYIADLNIGSAGVASFITSVRKEVRKVLGKCPKRHQLEPRFGPGSTYLDVGPLISVPDKMSECYTLTLNARVFLHAWDSTAWSRFAASGLENFRHATIIGNVEEAPGFSQNDTDRIYAPRTETVVRGNRFTTAPKDCKKHRGICIEPSINLFYQLGVGKWMTKCMKRLWNWDKKDQQQYHRFLARIGSLVGNLATIDLSNASDTVCYNLVKLLLPSDWFELLCSLRSTHTSIDGKWVKLEKFSSMGNGFTFELETILFRCIANVVSERSQSSPDWHGRVVSTFGDDIICPQDSAPDVIAALRFCGFSINRDKTFISGKFRESCGGDYFSGLDVRPHYLKEVPCEPHQYIALANGLRRFGLRHILCGGPDVYRKPRLRILDNLPSTIRQLTGPQQLGDLVVWDEESTWKTKVRSSIRYFRVWRPVRHGLVDWSHFRPGVVLASALYGVGDNRTKAFGSQEHDVTSSGGVLARIAGSYVSGYRLGHVAYS